MSVDSETLGMEYFTKNVMKNEWGNNFEEYYNHVNDQCNVNRSDGYNI